MSHIVIANEVFVPLEWLDEDEVRAKLWHFFALNPAICADCEHTQSEACAELPVTVYYGDEENEVMRKCDNYLGHAALYRKVVWRGRHWWAFPRDVFYKLTELFDLHPSDLKNIEDLTKDVPFPTLVQNKWALRNPLFEHQAKVIPDVQRLYNEIGIVRGTLEAQPRTGKTLTALTIAMQVVKQKTLIIACQSNLLDNFVNDCNEHTNAIEVSKALGYPLIQSCRTLSDFLVTPIACTTVQLLLKNPTLLNSIRDKFGFLLVDEEHKKNSQGFGHVINSFSVRNYLGITATFQKKSGMHVMMGAMLGEPLFFMDKASTVPTVNVHYIDCDMKGIKTSGLNLKPLYSRLMYDSDRITAILRYLLQDIKDGHCIVIPLYFLEHVQFLYDVLTQLGVSVGVFIGKGSSIRGLSSQDLAQDEVLRRARNGDFQVTIGIRSILGTGVTCAKWTALYTILPVADQFNFWQETKRVCTDAADKREPLLRYFIEPYKKTLQWFLTMEREVFDKYEYPIIYHGDAKHQIQAHLDKIDGVPDVSLVWSKPTEVKVHKPITAKQLVKALLSGDVPTPPPKKKRRMSFT